MPKSKISYKLRPALDRYKEEVKVNDLIVCNLGGHLSKAVVLSIKYGLMQRGFRVLPVEYLPKVSFDPSLTDEYALNVKDSRSTIRIGSFSEKVVDKKENNINNVPLQEWLKSE